MSYIFFTYLGCLNGGGQIRPEGEETSKELLTRVSDIYKDVKIINPETATHVDRLYTEWLEGADSEKAKKTLHTQYHEVEKMSNALTIKW